jgi:hypothetical protein
MRWRYLPGQLGGSAIAPHGAMNDARGGSPRILAPTVARSRTPSDPRHEVLLADRQPRQADQPAIVVRLLPTRLQRATANGSATSPPQAAQLLPAPCNEPLVSLPRGVQRNTCAREHEHATAEPSRCSSRRSSAPSGRGPRFPLGRCGTQTVPTCKLGSRAVDRQLPRQRSAHEDPVNTLKVPGRHRPRSSRLAPRGHGVRCPLRIA